MPAYRAEARAWRAARRRRVRLRGAAAGIAIALLAHAVVGAVPERFSGEYLSDFERRYGAAARERLLDWRSLVIDNVEASDAQKRARANAFFNRIPWLSDDEHWGKRDYWATPMEMLGSNGGDCEDYSIAKYFTLADMDVPTEKLLITYVRAPRIDQPHMVLAYYPTPDADPLILDNLDPEIRPGSERRDLVPVYSFNAEGLWQAVERGRGHRRVGSASRLNLWRDLLARMDRARG